MKNIFPNNLNKVIILKLLFITFTLLVVIPINVSVYAGSQSPTESARVFFQSLGYMNYKRSWQYLSSLSQRQNLIYLKKYFLAKGKEHQIYDLRYQVETNINGYRNLLFNDLFSKLTMKMGVKASSFKTAKIAYEKGDDKTAVIRLTVEEKHAYFKMVKEDGEWKVVFYIE